VFAMASLAMGSVDLGSGSAASAQWEDLMKAWKDVQAPATKEEAAQEEALEKEALKDAVMEEKVLGIGAKTPKTDILEKAITGMILEKGFSGSEAAFMATPFGDSVGKIIALIGKEMIPQVKEAHKVNQKELDRLAAALKKCGKARKGNIAIADKSKAKYFKFSPLHLTCRQGEAGKKTEMMECFDELADKKKVMNLKCKEYDMVDKKYGNQNSNGQIVKRQGGESTERYVKRLSATICGAKPKLPKRVPSKCGAPDCGFECIFMCAKNACEKATGIWKKLTQRCAKIKREYEGKQAQCNNIQDQMDGAACKRAIDMKDACEQYAECYHEKFDAYKIAEKNVKVEGKDRKAEWRGLKRMQCLMAGFKDGKMTNAEVIQCKEQTHTVTHLYIKYPLLDPLVLCRVPRAYPNTAPYKKAEFAPLPALAKGKEGANECSGLLEIPTRPMAGSPKSCKCERVTLNGPYSAGPIVRCTNCLDARRTADKNSCPENTKLFSPRSREDWKTIINSVKPLRAPHWIIDVTRPQNGCGGCTGSSMNSGNKNQKTWRTNDGTPWWLRSTKYSEPNGDYHANCYLDLWRTPKSENSITWNDGSAATIRSLIIASLQLCL